MMEKTGPDSLNNNHQSLCYGKIPPGPSEPKWDIITSWEAWYEYLIFLKLDDYADTVCLGELLLQGLMKINSTSTAQQPNAGGAFSLHHLLAALLGLSWHASEIDGCSMKNNCQGMRIVCQE